MPRLQALIFDLDGTLIDSPHTTLRWLPNHYLRSFGWSPPYSTLRRHFTKPSHEAVTAVAAELGHTLTPQAIKSFVLQAYEIKSHTPATPLPGTLNLLRQAQNTSVPLALCSNNSLAHLDTILENQSLSSFFPHRVGTDSTPHPKPAPDMYRLACSLLSLPPSSCLAIEDSLEGLTAAQSAGLPTLAVATGLHDLPTLQSQHPTLTLPNLSSITLQELLSLT